MTGKGACYLFDNRNVLCCRKSAPPFIKKTHFIRNDDLVKIPKSTFPVTPAKAGHAVKLQRYPVFSMASGCRITSGMTK